MKSFKILLGYLINSILGFVCYPLLWVAITDILGTAKDPAYTIQEPELSMHKFFGTWLLIMIIVGSIVSQILIKIFLFPEQKNIITLVYY